MLPSDGGKKIFGVLFRTTFGPGNTAGADHQDSHRSLSLVLQDGGHMYYAALVRSNKTKRAVART